MPQHTIFEFITTGLVVFVFPFNNYKDASGATSKVTFINAGEELL